MPRELWVKKTCEFEFPVEEYAGLMETLAAAPTRLAGLLEGVAELDLVRRVDESWSIQENAGHLTILEALFLGRLDDFDAGQEELRAADMSNLATEQGKLNERDIPELLVEFATTRRAYLDRLMDKPAEYFAKVAWHPRLKKPMRVVDQLKFQAEHDAHHFERIEELL